MIGFVQFNDSNKQIFFKHKRTHKLSGFRSESGVRYIYISRNTMEHYA